MTVEHSKDIFDAIDIAKKYGLKVLYATGSIISVDLPESVPDEKFIAYVDELQEKVSKKGGRIMNIKEFVRQYDWVIAIDQLYFIFPVVYSSEDYLIRLEALGILPESFDYIQIDEFVAMLVEKDDLGGYFPSAVLVRGERPYQETSLTFIEKRSTINTGKQNGG